METDDGQNEAGVLQTRVRDGILQVTLHRPDRGNALDVALINALRALWDDVADDDSLRCVIITGAGKAFCTGADVGMLADERRGGNTAADELSFVPGRRISIPVIAAVNGTCAGGGLHFVADADIAIASDRARFLDPHVTVGQVSALEPLHLRLRMRQDILTRMVLLGRSEIIDAPAAERAGLVSQVIPDADLLDVAWDLAARIAANSPAAVRTSRRVLRDLEERLLGDDLEEGWATIQQHWAHPDAQEGPNAFLEKRDPRWAR